MKKPLCMLLALSILLAFVSCAGPENESSRGESQVSQNTSETISGSDGDTVFVENELIAEIDSMLTGDAPDRTMKAKNLFVNATYTYSTTPLPDHNDTTFTKLNDGIRNDMYDKVTWVAFKGTTPVIQFDLGEGEHHLADVEINMLNQVDYGIHLPSSVTLSVSDDGEHYTKISTLHPPKDVSMVRQGSLSVAFSLCQLSN